MSHDNDAKAEMKKVLAAGPLCKIDAQCNLVKYSDDQARDETGKWAGGGESGASPQQAGQDNSQAAKDRSLGEEIKAKFYADRAAAEQRQRESDRRVSEELRARRGEKPAAVLPAKAPSAVAEARVQQESAQAEYARVKELHDRHNNLYNEGASGYNPHSAALREARLRVEINNNNVKWLRDHK